MMGSRIILLEDEELLRISLQRLLLKQGFEVLSFANPTLFLATEELRARDLGQDDFLLTDIHMPAMTGLDFIETQTENTVGQLLRNRGVMSAVWSDENLARAKRLGCRIFHKPFITEDVLNWLEARKNDFRSADDFSVADESISNLC